jgi:serine protease inhibitor
MRKFVGAVSWVLFAALVLGSGCADSWQPPRQLSADEIRLAQAANDFGLDFFREAVAQSAGGNLFVSPLSISMALGMAWNGARAGTEAAMRQALRFGDLSPERVNQGFLGLIALLTTMDPAVRVEIANSIWYRQGLEVLQSFIDVNVAFFQAVVRALNFDDPAAADTINAWVAEKTHGLIKEIVQKPIDPMLVMFLINAVYFKGDWAYRFDKSRTQPGTFHAPDGDVTVQMMYQEGKFRVLGGENFAAIDLPYGHELFRMTILLPDAGVQLNELVGALTPENWKEWISQLDQAPTRELDVYLPRFELEWESRLKQVLSAMGMAEAFDPALANFTGIVAGGGIFISDVVHKTYVRVDEQGTEAAAVTSVEMGATSVPEAFRVDRPFVFVIHDRHSGAILFAGKIVNPSSR